MTTHRYVSWFRRGIAAARTNPELAGANPTVKASMAIGGAAHEVAVTLHGPADIAGLAASAITRRDPPPNALGVSPYAMPFVEIWPPDLPWRFSPAPTPAGGQANILPWLCLVVVPASAPLGPRSGAPLPLLQVTAGELPDPADAWAWAHVQIEEPPGGLGTTSPAAYIRDQPRSAVARLLAPRRMSPGASYRACLVPVYEAGRRAGLGTDLANVGLEMAWSVAEPSAPIELPVYDSWLIETGVAADFETIARRLRGVDADDVFEPLAVDVRAAAARAEPIAATMFGLVRPPHGTDTLPEAALIATTLEPWLTIDQAAPAVGPPLYAAAQTGATALTGVAPWQRTLNLDPRRRAQAAAGASIVRSDQEQLVADAQQAIGQADRANALVRGAQLASLLVPNVLARHVAPRPPVRVLAMLWPTLAGSQVATTAGHTPGATTLLAPGLRRLARPRGPIARKRVAGLAFARIGHDLSLAVTAVPLPPTLTVTVHAIQASTLHAPRPPIDAARLAEIRDGLARRLRRQIDTTVVATFPVTPPAPPPDAGSLAASALARVAPLAVANQAIARIDGALQLTSVGQLAEVQVGPDLSRPLADRLATLRPEVFAPGLGKLDPDRVTVLKVDPATVEAVLAGANDELMRELAWRGVTVDRKLTLLSQMWARVGMLDGNTHDIAAIASWTGELGGNVLGAVRDPTVFFVRSELVRRFPNAFYAIERAVTDNQVGRRPGDDPPVLPLFQGLAAPDLAYIGFAKELGELEGDPAWKRGSTTDPGWYFTIQERPGHIRFGLDAARTADEPMDWVNLSWGDVGTKPYVDLAHAPAGFPTHPRWGSTGGAMAAISERPAVRVAFHVHELLVR